MNASRFFFADLAPQNVFLLKVCNSTCCKHEHEVWNLRTVLKRQSVVHKIYKYRLLVQKWYSNTSLRIVIRSILNLCNVHLIVDIIFNLATFNAINALRSSMIQKNIFADKYCDNFWFFLLHTISEIKKYSGGRRIFEWSGVFFVS